LTDHAASEERSYRENVERRVTVDPVVVKDRREQILFLQLDHWVEYRRVTKELLDPEDKKESQESTVLRETKDHLEVPVVMVHVEQRENEDQ